MAMVRWGSWNPSMPHLAGIRPTIHEKYTDTFIAPMIQTLHDEKQTPGQTFTAVAGTVMFGIMPHALQLAYLGEARNRFLKAYASQLHLEKWGKAHLRHGIHSATALEYRFNKEFLKVRRIVPLGPRIASRILPGIGWALLAWDVHTLATKGSFWGFRKEHFIKD